MPKIYIFCPTSAYSVLPLHFQTNVTRPILSYVTSPKQSQPVLSYPTLSNPTTPYPKLSHRTLSYPIQSYPVLSYSIPFHSNPLQFAITQPVTTSSFAIAYNQRP